MQISKSQFKARVVESLRKIESTVKCWIITDKGRPTLEIRPYTPTVKDPLELLKGSVLRYERPTDPVDDDTLEAAK